MRPQGVVLAFLAIASAVRPATAQRREASFTTSDAGVLVAGVASSAVLIGWDRQISNAFRESALQRNEGIRGVMGVGRSWGDPGSTLLAAGLWVSGRLRHDRTHEQVGLRALEAIVFSNVFTLGGKAAFGRARPDHSPGMPRDFVLGRGFGDRNEFQALPSGHATAAFALASAIDTELDRIAPEHPGWIAPLLYGVATATAVSRVYHDRHWASDVVLGSAIGFVGGRVVVRWHGDRR